MRGSKTEMKRLIIRTWSYSRLGKCFQYGELSSERYFKGNWWLGLSLQRSGQAELYFAQNFDWKSQFHSVVVLKFLSESEWILEVFRTREFSTEYLPRGPVAPWHVSVPCREIGGPAKLGTTPYWKKPTFVSDVFCARTVRQYCWRMVALH